MTLALSRGFAVLCLLVLLADKVSASVTINTGPDPDGGKPRPTAHLEVVSAPTPGLDNFTTYTIWAHTESWNSFLGGNFANGLNILGPMHHAYTERKPDPLSGPLLLVGADLPPPIPIIADVPILVGDVGSTAQRAMDSHFLLTNDEAEFSWLSETSNSLQGAFDLSEPKSGPLAIAQIVAANERRKAINVFGKLHIQGGISSEHVEYRNAGIYVSYSVRGVPEPSTLAMGVIAAVAMLVGTQRLRR